MTTTNVVLFDIGNIILRATHKITEAILWELGVRPDKAALFFHGKYYSDFARGKITGAMFAEAVRDALEAPHLSDDTIRTAHDAHIYMVDEHIIRLLQELWGANIPLAFVTTTNEWQTARELRLIRLAERFGPVIRSHEIRMTKTDPGAWPEILNRLGWQDRDPSTILLVDDSSGNCVEAWNQARIRSHQYDPTPVVGIKKLETALREHGVLP